MVIMKSFLISSLFLVGLSFTAASSQAQAKKEYHAKEDSCHKAKSQNDN